MSFIPSKLGLRMHLLTQINLAMVLQGIRYMQGLLRSSPTQIIFPFFELDG